MAKSIPTRLPQDLFQLALQQGVVSQRSAAQQIEHWARLGRLVSAQLTLQEQRKVQAGLAALRLEEKEEVDFDLDALLEDLDRRRKSGELSDSFVTHLPRYRASREHPGLLEEVSPEGHVRVGQFKDGAFVETHPR